MATADHSVVPDFEDNIHLETIDLPRLRQRDPAELSKLLQACETHGFLYLKLQEDDDDSGIIQDWESLLSSAKRYFDLPVKVKMRDHRNNDTTGYKPLGAYAGVQPNSRDHYENLKVSRDEMWNDPDAVPESVKEEMALWNRFFSYCNSVSLDLLEYLSNAMQLRDKDQFTTSHQTTQASKTNLITFRYPRQDSLESGIGHNKHTDLGTLTVLFIRQFGLQILSTTATSNSSSEWRYVVPKPRHAIINVGDSLRFLSGNRLKSAVHRVYPVGGIQRETRYAIAFFLRPADEAEFQDSNGRTITAAEWNDCKFKVFRQTHEQQESDTILTGGMERRAIVETVV